MRTARRWNPRRSGGVAGAAAAGVAAAREPVGAAAPRVPRHRAARRGPLIARARSTTSSAPTWAWASCLRPTSTTTCSSAAAAAPARAVPPAATSCACTCSRAATPTSRCSRAAASSSTTSPRQTDDDVDRRQHLPRQGAERAARAWRPRSSTSARRRTACSTAATSRSTPSDVEGRQAQDRALLKNGQTVLVQVTKNPIGAKGARLTQEVSLAGRFVVMVPGEPETYGISKRLPDDERKRLRADPRRAAPSRRRPHRAHRGRGRDPRGARARRVAPARPVGADLGARRASRSRPKLLYQEPDARRAAHPRGVHQGVPRHRHRRPRALRGGRRLRRGDRARARRPGRVLRQEEEGLPIFERFHVHEQLHEGARPQGVAAVGRLAHHRAHRGAHRDRREHGQERRASRTSRRPSSATTSRRPTRSPASSGCATSAGSSSSTSSTWRSGRTATTSCGSFRDALARDKTRTQVFDISELGLVEMTRKRISEGLVESFSETCPTCQGRGSSSTSRCCRSSTRVHGVPSTILRDFPRHVRSDPHRRQAVPVEEGQRSRSSAWAPTTAPRSSSQPVLLVDGDTVLATPDQLASAVGEGQGRRRGQGPEDHGFTYKPKSNKRRRWGHRQHYSMHRDHRDHKGRATSRSRRRRPTTSRASRSGEPEAAEET